MIMKKKRKKKREGRSFQLLLDHTVNHASCDGGDDDAARSCEEDERKS